MNRIESAPQLSAATGSEAVMVKAFVTTLYTSGRLLQMIGAYLATPTIENRESVADLLFGLQDAAQVARIAMQEIRQRLVEDNAADLKPQLARYRAAYQHGLYAIQRYTHRIVELPRSAHTSHIHEIAQALSEEAEALVSLWQQTYAALTKEQPRHVRHFFNYVCERFDSLNGATTHLAIAALNRRAEEAAEAHRQAEIESEVLLRSPLPEPTRSRQAPAEVPLTRAYGST